MCKNVYNKACIKRHSLVKIALKRIIFGRICFAKNVHIGQNCMQNCVCESAEICTKMVMKFQKELFFKMQIVAEMRRAEFKAGKMRNRGKPILTGLLRETDTDRFSCPSFLLRCSFSLRIQSPSGWVGSISATNSCHKRSIVPTEKSHQERSSGWVSHSEMRWRLRIAPRCLLFSRGSCLPPHPCSPDRDWWSP